MASLAVFKQLFNSGNDIFSIIAEFVKQEIISNGLTNFTEQQMHDMIYFLQTMALMFLRQSFIHL